MKYAKRPDLFTVNSKDGIPLVKANSDYGRFNCNNMGANLQSWNYRSCWHQTGPLLDFDPLEKRIRKKAEKNLAIAHRSLEVIDALVAAGI